MSEASVILTPLHYIYLIGVVVILAVMILRRDTPAVCIGFLFLIGLVGLGSITGGIMTIFTAILYAAREFMEIIATIALVTALSKCLKDLGSDYLMMVPMRRVMKSPGITWWILGITMLIFSLFLWPSPSVALVGAIMLPFAVKAGLKPLLAAMAMNLFGHGIALSYDFVIQGAPAVSAAAAGISPSDILTQGRFLFWAMSISTVVSAYLINRREMAVIKIPDNQISEAVDTSDTADTANTISGKNENHPRFSRAAKIVAILTPLAFFLDIVLMLALDLKGGDATSMVSGTAVLIMCAGAVIGFGGSSLEKITGYVTDGFLFAIKIFAPVILIGAFFFLGGSGITNILGDSFQGGIMNDWAIWLAAHTPINKYSAALIQMVVGGLTGLDGSGFSGLPLTGSLAQTLGNAVGVSVPVLAALGQITAVFVGGGTIVPWGLIPVAAICNVSPMDLARKNIVPVFIGFLFAFLAACLLL